MNSNDKAMYEFAKLLEKVDAEVGFTKEAKKKDVKEDKKEKNTKKDDKKKEEVKSKKKTKKKAEVLQEAVQTLVSLASELDNDGHAAAADLVDDALQIIVNELS